MGHERVGHLPKTHKWRQLVEQIAGLYSSEIEVSDIANQTMQNVRSRLRGIQQDEGVQSAFQFLVTLSVASRSPEPEQSLKAAGIQMPENVTPLALAKSLDKWMSEVEGSFEYHQIAKSAAVDAIAIWHDQHKTTQTKLFEPLNNPYRVWKEAASGAGFCELSRLFFAKFTERYLNYFLDREASAALSSLQKRERFRRQLEEHIERISRHAFETSKITQSFSAGWFNKNTRQGIPDKEAIEGFLSIAFGKIRGELQRGGEE
jgi:hypothetical protein